MHGNHHHHYEGTQATTAGRTKGIILLNQLSCCLRFLTDFCSSCFFFVRSFFLFFLFVAHSKSTNFATAHTHTDTNACMHLQRDKAELDTRSLEGNSSEGKSRSPSGLTFISPAAASSSQTQSARTRTAATAKNQWSHAHTLCLTCSTCMYSPSSSLFFETQVRKILL